MIRGGVVFPNTHFNSAGRTTIGLWLPLSAGKTEVWRWLFVPRNAPAIVKDTLREYYLRYAGPAGMVEQDDMENWTAAQRGTRVSSRANTVQLPARDGAGAARASGRMARRRT